MDVIYRECVDLLPRHQVIELVPPPSLPAFQLSSFCQKVTIFTCAFHGLASYRTHLLFNLARNSRFLA